LSCQFYIEKVYRMKKNILFVALCSFALACNEPKKQTEQSETPAAESVTEKDSAALVKHGEYLVNIIGCDDCHSPKQMGAKGPEIIADLRFSGYPAQRKNQAVNQDAIKAGWALLNSDLTSAVGPWGQSFASNISSDATGIGNWSLEHFVTAMREGKNKGLSNGRPLLPPMPWYNFAKMTDEDLKSMFYFLKTTKAINNIVPAPIPPAGN